MVKDREHIEDKGASTCPQGEVTSLGDVRNLWSFVRYNSNNAWYVNTNCNVNNTNTYNRYVGAGVSELSDNIDEILCAERACYSNKHDSTNAVRTHYHLSIVNDLAKAISEGKWQQGRGYVFVCTYPTVREIWAACYTDRIVHHLVAPIIVDACEKVHTATGNVSHGNRKGHSADTACLQILENMRKFPRGFVGTRDLSGFFMSIEREKAYDTLTNFTDKNDYLPIIRQLILHNPTLNCDIRSSAEGMALIPENKSLFHSEPGKGLPIGNFYSQLVANLYLWEVDALHLSAKWVGRVGYTRFVDDMCVMAENPQVINEFFDDVEAIVRSLGCRMHIRKRYMQPIWHGVSFCGRTIKPHGIYMNNRLIHAIKDTIEQIPPDKGGAETAVKSLNSYFGFLKHCKSFKIQKDITNDVMKKWGPYLHYKNNGRQIVFGLNQTPKMISRKTVKFYKSNAQWNS